MELPRIFRKENLGNTRKVFENHSESRTKKYVMYDVTTSAEVPKTEVRSPRSSTTKTQGRNLFDQSCAVCGRIHKAFFFGCFAMKSVAAFLLTLVQLFIQVSYFFSFIAYKV